MQLLTPTPCFLTHLSCLASKLSDRPELIMAGNTPLSCRPKSGAHRLGWPRAADGTQNRVLGVEDDVLATACRAHVFDCCHHYRHPTFGCVGGLLKLALIHENDSLLAFGVGCRFLKGRLNGGGVWRLQRPPSTESETRIVLQFGVVRSRGRNRCRGP